MLMQILEVKFYSAADIAEMLGMTTRTVLNYINDGKIVAKRIGKKWMVSEDNLRAWMEHNDAPTPRNRNKDKTD